MSNLFQSMTINKMKLKNRFRCGPRGYLLDLSIRGPAVLHELLAVQHAAHRFWKRAGVLASAGATQAFVRGRSFFYFGPWFVPYSGHLCRRLPDKRPDRTGSRGKVVAEAFELFTEQHRSVRRNRIGTGGPTLACCTKAAVWIAGRGFGRI